MCVDLLTCTGIRVSEAVNLRIKDLHISQGKSEVFVNGKGSVCGTVQIPKGLKKHLKSFLKWKADSGESIEPNSSLFIGQRDP